MATAAIAVMPKRLFATDASTSTSLLNLRELGRLATLSSKDIKSSPFSIGFETLDRQMFDPTRTYEPLGKLGVKWARVQTGWNRCETVKGQYDFAWLDEVVDPLLAQGIQPWFNLGFGNRLYMPEAEPLATGWPPIFTKEARAGWAAFVEAIAKHFASRIKCWEIWNEPNAKTNFWKPGQANPNEYMVLVNLTAPLLRRWIPDATLIGLALSGCRASATEFLETCMKAGLGNHVDRISFHPYGQFPEKVDNYEQFLATARELRKMYNPGLRLWQGECGCPSAPSHEKVIRNLMVMMPWTEARQARWLLRRILIDLNHDMDLIGYFHTVDLLHYNRGSGPTDYDQRMGVLRGEDYSPKPSYFAYQTLCTMFADGRTKCDGSLAIARDGAPDETFRSASFVREGRVLYAWWSAVDLFQDFMTHSCVNEAPMARTITLRLPTPAGRATIDEPVLIDPISQRVYQLSGQAVNDTLVLTDLPSSDHAWIVTDRSVVPLRT
jgi:hypothetical protein